MSLQETLVSVHNRLKPLDEQVRRLAELVGNPDGPGGQYVEGILRELQSRTGLRQCIDEALPLLLARREARKLVLERLSREEQEVGEFRADGPSSDGLDRRALRDARRIVAFQAWIAATWSGYDILTEVLHTWLLEEPGEKAPRGGEFPDLLGAEDVRGGLSNLERRLGLGVVKSLRAQYGWGVSLAYLIRNCLLHNGGWRANRQMFRGMPEHGYDLADDDYRLLLEKCAKDHRLRQREFLRPQEHPQSKDLAKLLDACFADADACMGKLLDWAVAQLERQVHDVADAVRWRLEGGDEGNAFGGDSDPPGPLHPVGG
ncbi:MAG: hypothetical protein FJ109_16400, partial [Deltaproteobacteria bacterium]|nr:hypothetical protein [Deltaproteobacteria bacterium]